MIVHGFELIQDQLVPELQCNIKYYMHCGTGAKLISVTADDNNKVFGISFRTPVANSTGVPHILEHAVLCGSDRYPVKKPFLELLRGSLFTFLNAFTSLDHTIYPVASLNLKSFYNLVDVYLDAVFHPLLSRETFEQEGWRHHLDAADAALQYKGVVYNEMKGAQSSPLSLAMRAARSALFEAHPYVHDSGGVPGEIPDLTWEQLKAYHADHYHPANAIVFFYGNDDPDYRLKRMDAEFRGFAYQRPDTRIPLFPLDSRHRRRELSFAPTEAGRDKGFITRSWLLPTISDRIERMLLHTASSCLLGSSSAPLYKALIDSGLGEDVIATGISFALCQPIFSVGMEGVDPAHFPAVEALIDDTLATIAAQGFDDDLIEAVLNSQDFAFREFSNHSFPRGMILMMGAVSSTMYEKRMGGTGPGSLEILARIRAMVAADKQVLQAPLTRYLLDSGHRATVTLVPDMGEEQRLQQQETERLQAHASSLDADTRSQLADHSAQLQAYQMEPDTPEALATLPVLALTDIQRETQEYPCEEQELAGVPYLSHDLFTHGIMYAKCLFDLHALPQQYLPYLDIFQTALRQTGTVTEDFVTFSRRIAGQTGGIGVSDTIMSHFESEAAAAYLTVSGKCLAHQIADMASLMGDILYRARLDDRTRIQQLLHQARTHMESGLIPGGHYFVNSRLTANQSETDWLDETTGGLSALFFLRDLCDNFDSRWPDLLATLEEMRTCLIRTGNMMVSVISPAQEQESLRAALRPVVAALPDKAPVRQRWQPDLLPEQEALCLPVPVNYVGRAYNLAGAGFQNHGAVSIATRLINTSWLWPRVREQGGAYGCSASFDRFNGHLSFVSYRDPNISNTLDIYDGTADFLRQCSLERSELDKLIIGTFGALDQDLQPRAQGAVALQRHLTGHTRTLRQQRRDEILATDEADIRQLAHYIAAAQADCANTVVMGSEAALQKATEDCGIAFASRTML